MKLKKSDESIFRDAIDCMDAARTGFDYMVTNPDRFDAVIERLEYFRDIAANVKSEKTWQITDERKDAIGHAIRFLPNWPSSVTSRRAAAVLQDMQEEAGQ